MRKDSRRKLLAVVSMVLLCVMMCSMTVFAAEEPPKPELYATFWALVPPVVAIALALITKEVYSSLFVGILVGALFYSGFSFEGTVTHIFQGGIISVLSDSYNVGILVFLVILGAMVSLMNRAGGSAAFGRWAGEHIKTRVGAQLATVVLGVLIFIDDYFNCLTVGSVMRPVTDKHNVSRAKLGLLVLTIFAVQLGWFPIGMAVPAGKLAADVTLGDRIYHLILPVLTLTIVSISEVVLYTRQKVIEIMNSDFILYARARGENGTQLVKRHVLRNVALPAVTVQFASFNELFGGMALAETVFAYPGIGNATTAAAVNADVPLLLGIAIFSALFVFAGNLIANLLYGVFDPRIREGEKRG